MELENFLKERKIDPKIIAVLIDLKEPLDEIIEYLKEHNLEMDGCTFEYKDNTYWVYDQQEADESVLDFVDEMVIGLRVETNHEYDWLIDYIDSNEVACTMKFEDVYPDYKQISYNSQNYYYQEE